MFTLVTYFSHVRRTETFRNTSLIGNFVFELRYGNDSAAGAADNAIPSFAGFTSTGWFLAYHGMTKVSVIDRLIADNRAALFTGIGTGSVYFSA